MRFGGRRRELRRNLRLNEQDTEEWTFLLICPFKLRAAVTCILVPSQSPTRALEVPQLLEIIMTIAFINLS